MLICDTGALFAIGILAVLASISIQIQPWYKSIPWCILAFVIQVVLFLGGKI